MVISVGLTVNGQWIETPAMSLVSNSKNIYKCVFTFSDDWNGYIKTAVFMLNSGDPMERPVTDNACVIPWEALQESGNLKIGVFGLSGSEPDITRYPTVWTQNIPVIAGVPDSDPGRTPSPSAYQQFVMSVQDSAKEAEKAATDAQDAAKQAGDVLASVEEYIPGEYVTFNDTEDGKVQISVEVNGNLSPSEGETVDMDAPVSGSAVVSYVQKEIEDSQKPNPDDPDVPTDPSSVPGGIIAMWNRTEKEIPTGWVLCDGTNGTPDLRGAWTPGPGIDTYSIFYIMKAFD